MENNTLKANSTSRLAVVLMAVSGAAPAMCVGGSFGTLASASGTNVALAFLVATLGIVFAGLNYGSMAMRHNGCGGTYSYVKAAMGVRMGFWTACVYVVPLLCAAIPCALSAVNLNYLVPGIPSWVWGFAVAAVLFLICIRGIELTSTALIIVWVLQMVLLIWPAIKIISMTAGDLDTSWLVNSMQAFNPGAEAAHGFSGVTAGALVAIWAFVGFEAPAYMGEEIKGGAKSVRFCLIAGGILCGVIYAIVCWLWVGAMTPEQMAVLAGHENFLVAYCEMVGYIMGGKIVALSIIFSALACGLVFLSMGSRFYYDMGRKGYLPKVFARTNKFKAPHVGLILYTAHWYLIGIFGMYGDINWLFNLQAISAVLSYMIVCVANAKDRWKDNGSFGAIIGSKIVPLLALAVLMTMFVTSDFMYMWPLIIWWAVAVVIMLVWYPGYKRRREAGEIIDPD